MKLIFMVIIKEKRLEKLYGVHSNSNYYFINYCN